MALAAHPRDFHGPSVFKRASRRLEAALTYWSATSVTDEQGFVLTAHFFLPYETNVPILVTDVNTGKGTSHLSWAVRGGLSALTSSPSESTSTARLYGR
jgi:hypothetical protein